MVSQHVREALFGCVRLDAHLSYGTFTRRKADRERAFLTSDRRVLQCLGEFCSLQPGFATGNGQPKLDPLAVKIF